MFSLCCLHPPIDREQWTGRKYFTLAVYLSIFFFFLLFYFLTSPHLDEGLLLWSRAVSEWHEFSFILKIQQTPCCFHHRGNKKTKTYSAVNHVWTCQSANEASLDKHETEEDCSGWIIESWLSVLFDVSLRWEELETFKCVIWLFYIHPFIFLLLLLTFLRFS